MPRLFRPRRFNSLSNLLASDLSLRGGAAEAGEGACSGHLDGGAKGGGASVQPPHDWGELGRGGGLGRADLKQVECFN